MKNSALYVCLALIGVGGLLTGCYGPLARFADKPPAAPKTADGDRVKTVDLAQAPAAEVKAVTDQQVAKVNYRYRLGVLEGFYNRQGDMTKTNWARQEIENLDEVQTFTWQGIPEIKPPKGEDVARADEKVLVEAVTAARKEYLAETEKLRAYYESINQSFKHSLVQNMQERLDPVRVYRYYISAEVPPDRLQPRAVIPQADALYEQAYKDFKSARILPAVTNYPKMKRALVQFLKLVDNYPTSNKIAASAFYIGEIYKEYFREYVRSVHWYQRAWQWDPTLPLPSRFQAATVYDFHLQNKRMALKCYRGVIEHEQFKWTNVRYSRQRIGELTGNPEE